MTGIVSAFHLWDILAAIWRNVNFVRYACSASPLMEGMTMLNLELNIQPATERRLRQLMSQIGDQEMFAQNIIAFQVHELKRGILNLRLDLKKFEEQYEMPSDVFYGQFEQGGMDDREDYMLWSGLYEMWQDNQQRLQALQ
jgi:hypothetical protein